MSEENRKKNRRNKGEGQLVAGNSDKTKEKRNAGMDRRIDKTGVIYLDDMEGLDRKEPKHSRGRRRRHGKEKTNSHKKVWIAVGSGAGILLVIYIGFAVFFMSHYYFSTKINGTDFSGKSVAQVKEYMQKKVDDYKLTIKEDSGNTETIDGADISISYESGDELQKVMDAQNPFLWPSALFKKSNVTAQMGVKYDESALEEQLAGLSCMEEENQTAPKSAQPVFDGAKFTVQKEEQGTQIDVETFRKKVKESIEGFRQEIDLRKDECYVAPSYTADSEEVKKTCDDMNQYLNAKITYDFGKATEVVDKALISEWLTVDDKMQASFDTDKVKEYLRGIGKKYDTKGTKRSITTPDGKKTTVTGGTYGWEVDEAKELELLTADIKAGKETKREPAYVQKAASREEQDWGTTYIEVDLTTQHMWLIVDGGVVFSTDIVTGKPTPEKETPQGVYDILEKKRNKTLRGDRQTDGSYEYETPVSYWMRVTWTGIGFHDATWQSAFGGELYKTKGSHGCINMSLKDAGTLYDKIDLGYPVVMHY